ncbi:hypothetical protein K501DRAFT_197796 [Backusella circina FSU 941]|nr:hypothetical protein K501DRAFT_197796 [Backusella circina FSU 941]
MGCHTDLDLGRARYAVSYICATLVYDQRTTFHCGNTSLTIPLCQSTCDLYSQSVQTVIQDSCNNATILNSLSTQCINNVGLNGRSSTGCVAGTDNNDNELCGKNKMNSAIIGIILGSVIGVSLCLLSIYYFCLYKKKRNRRRTIIINNEKICSSNPLPPPSTAWKNGYPIDDDDYTEIVPDINMSCEDGVKGHVFKVNSLEKQFVRVIYQLTSPQNPDELELLKGDIIRMYYYFDDGWAFGKGLKKERKVGAERGKKKKKGGR